VLGTYSSREAAMPANEIIDALRRRPFLPFRLVFADGTEYEVRHPELLHVGMASITIIVPHPDNPHMYQRVEVIDSRHVIKLVRDEALAAQG
jgi:hypothetical protein